MSLRDVAFASIARNSTSSWTLPSHASMFTGRWPHELSAGWLTPLDGKYPTVAEYLAEHGYATAGFTANYWYCASSSGLARGFTVYRDFIFPRLTAFKPAVLISRPLAGLEAVTAFLEEWLDVDALYIRPAAERLTWLFKWNRKAAADVNRELLDWLSHRPQPERPFFTFLNYYDAHHPYQLPELGVHRFGITPDHDRPVDPIDDPFAPVQTALTPRQVQMAQDAYDNCVADLDEQLGRLIDELESPRRPWPHVGRHRRRSWRELRRACRCLPPRDEPVPDGASCSSVDHSAERREEAWRTDLHRAGESKRPGDDDRDPGRLPTRFAFPGRVAHAV